MFTDQTCFPVVCHAIFDSPFGNLYFKECGASQKKPRKTSKCLGCRTGCHGCCAATKTRAKDLTVNISRNDKPGLGWLLAPASLKLSLAARLKEKPITPPHNRGHKSLAECQEDRKPRPHLAHRLSNSVAGRFEACDDASALQKHMLNLQQRS